jgi:hypothetical protein
MERRVEELLKLLHSLAFTDSDSIVNEIRQIVLSPSISMPSMSFFSSKLLNSEVSLLQFILKNRTESDRLLWKTMSNTLTLVSDYIQERGARIAEYAVEIKDTCLQLMASSTKSSMVKEAALGPLIRLLEVFSPGKLKEILDPRELFKILLDHKLRYEERTLGSNLKGAIFEMLGLLVNSFPEELDDRVLELQKIMLVRIKEQLYKGSKTEEKTVAGILKGFAHALKAFKYEEHDMKEIFNYIKALLTPIQSGRYTVLKASLKVLCENSNLFKEMIHAYSQEVLRELFNLIKSNNSKVKYLAQETSENVLAVLAEVVVDLQDVTCFEYTLKMLTSQIASKSPEIIQNTIKHIGVFSKAIATLKSEDYLKTLLSTIIDLSKESITSESEPEDFKGMILRQKRLNSLLTAYSDIARSLKAVPEPALLHFSEVAIEIFHKNATWHKKYRQKLYNSLAQLFASLYTHSETFTQWIRVFIVKAMRQLLVFDDSTSRIEAAGKLWLGVLQQECLTENALVVLTDEILRFFYQLLLTLDLNYATFEGNLQPSNPDDQQVLFQASEFLAILWPQICKRTDSWIMLFFTAVSRKIGELPLLPSLYNMAKVALKVCDLNSYCDSDLQCKQTILEMIKTVINSMQNFQDALLSSCIELCLSVPISIVYSPNFNNLSLFQPVVMQALSLSLSYLPLAHTVINTLNSWRKKIPMSSLKSILPTVLPSLSPFLTLDKISQEIAGQEELTKTRQKKRTVAFRIFKFIGSLGGESHHIIDEKSSHCSFVDFQSDLQMTMRLNKHSLEVNFDQVLPRVLHLAEKSNDSRTKIASCELLHALILFTIGKRTESEVQFDKIYSQVFPVVYRLATDLDPVSRQLFEPLTKQLVRWFAKKFPFDSVETQALLIALEASVCSPSSALRNLGSDCIGEYCKYSVINTLDPLPPFKQILKRIQSFSTHPQVEKRRAAVQCFSKLLLPMSQNEVLLSRFLMEFTHEMFVACKLAHYDNNEEILKTCKECLGDLKIIIQRKVNLLIGTCDERTFHKNIFEFIEWLWDFCKRPERIVRETAQEYWKDLVIVSKFDVKKWKIRKNFIREVQDDVLDCVVLEGVIEFYLWVSECGLFSWKGDELVDVVKKFLKSDKKNVSCQDSIRTFLAVLKHNQYFPMKEVDHQLLLEILISPQNLGIYSNVETKEVNSLYSEVCSKSIETLKNLGIDSAAVLKSWDSVDLEHERNLKLALQGIQLLVNSQDSLKTTLSPFFTQVLEKSMLEHFLKHSTSRRGKVILDFLIKVQISKDCLRILLKSSSVMSQHSEQIFEFILHSMSEHLETLFLAFADKPAQLLVFLVPILEKGKLLIEQKSIDLRTFIKTFLKQAVPLFAALALVPSSEISLGVIRTYCIFLEYSKDLSVFNEGVQEIVSTSFYPHVLLMLQRFLATGQHFSVQKEALRLLVAVWEVFGGQVMKDLRIELQEIQVFYTFQSSSPGSASKQASESEMMVKSFLEMFLRVRTFECLELLFALIREQKSSFEAELKHVLNEFIKFQVTQDGKETFCKVLKVFNDADSDKGMTDNVRWGLATRVIVPFIDFVDEYLAEDFMILTCKELISRLNDVKFTQIFEAKDYFLLLREKTFILMIVERFLNKVPASRFKENVHKAIFGPSAQGNELTKQIITFCDKYRKDRLENSEIIENLPNSSEYIREFLQNSFACLLTCIRKTQSQEKVFFNFLFKDTNWKNLIEDREDFNFKPQSNYFQKDLAPAPSEKISTLYISSSLFSQELAVLRPEKRDFFDQNETFSSQSLDLEPDFLNSLPIMKPLLEVIEKMENLYQSVEMPQWMQCLHSCLSDNCFVSIKLFVIKVVLNRPKSFERWAGLWLAPICAVMSGKNGGKGFHYFLRDTCTLLLYDWPDVSIKGKEKECSKFLNYLIKVVADTNEKIFKSNLQLIQGLLKKWKTPVDHSYLEGMMKKTVNDDENKSSVIWKISGVLIFGYCIEENVKVLQDGKENSESLDDWLLKCLDVNRRAVVTAAAEVIGKRLRQSPALATTLLEVLKKKESKDIGVYVNILEKIALSYPQILDHKQVSGKVNYLLASLSGNVRASLLQAIFHYCLYLTSQNSLNSLPDICEYLNREKERIANDNEDSHRLALLKLIQSLQDFIENPSVKRLLSGIFLQLGPFAGASSAEIRKALYEVMQQAYRTSLFLEDPVAIRSKSREILLKGLTDTIHSESILDFWNSQERLSLDPQTRMFQCLSELYTAECEELWLVVSSHLILRLCRISPEYEKMLFELPLDNCEFTQINFNISGKNSLPMTPMFSPSYFQQEGIKRKENAASSQGGQSRPQRIRHFAEYSQASFEERREKALKIQMERVEQKIKEQRERRGNILRTYRAGELPDIQIKSSDILGPLSNLVLLDCETASHIWVSLCPKLFTHLEVESRKKIIQAINRVLEISQNCNPDVISCMHRTLRELVSQNGDFARSLNAKHIYSSGVKSMCYQSAIMLLQECLLKFDPGPFNAHSGNEESRVTHGTSDFWIYLAKVYEKMGDLDSVKGLWVKIFSETAPKTLEDIRSAFQSKSMGDLTTANEVYCKVLPVVSKELRGMIKSEYEDSLAHLGKWSTLKEGVVGTNSIKLKSLLRLNQFAELTEVVQSLPSSSLYTRFPYEMSLLNVTQDDTDRARYYMDQDFSRFVEKWQALNPLSYLARHKLVQKAQKIHDLAEFLSIKEPKRGESTEEYLERVAHVVKDWQSRLPSSALDDLATWEEVLFARVLFFDKLKASVDFEPFGLDEFSSFLYAKFSEFPLKLGLFQVAEVMLKEALNRRTDPSRVAFTILAPVLKLRAKTLSFNSVESETSRIVNYFKSLTDRLHANSDLNNENAVLLYAQLQNYLIKALSDRRDCGGYLKESTKQAFEYFDKVKKEFPLKFCRFCDAILRKFEENQEALGFKLGDIGLAPENLAQGVILNCFSAMKLNSQRAHDMFPRLISLLRYQNTEKVFEEQLKTLPEWMLIRWISQILSIFDQPKCDVFLEIIGRLIRSYPQVFFYYFKTFTSVDSFQSYCKIFKGFKSKTWQMAEEMISSLAYLQDFVDALDQLVNPEQRLRYYLDLINEGATSGASSEFFRFLASEMQENLLKSRCPGTYNKKFASEWEKIFTTVLGGPLSNLAGKNTQELALFVENCKGKIKENPIDKPMTLISVFSEWLSDYSLDPYTQELIDLPWTNTGFCQPMQEKQVRVVSFDQNVLILRSIRKPKRIGIHGSDEKLYHVMIKGGEDLRLDQRIQQVFTVMNRIFQSSPECARSNLSLKTFEIVPITKRLGLLEWVSNTEPLRSIIDFELDKHYKIKGIGQTHANHLRKTWLRSLAAASDDNYVQHHMIALTKDFTSVVNNFKTHEKSIPWDLIRQSLLNMGRTPESFLYFRKKFIDSLATLSIAGYIIGLGDRHLDNFLLDRSDGSLVLIDFGVSFGQGISLGIPELMPFRLTRQFQSVFSPEGLEGQFRHSMLNSLKSLQKNQNTLLDCCEVFINEPLQDWMRGSSIDKNIPLKKLRILKQKLNGSNSGHIMTQELQDSKHLNMVRNS